MHRVIRVAMPGANQVRIELPLNAEFLTVAVVNGQLSLMFRGDIDAPIETRSFSVVAEGREIPLGADFLGAVVGGAVRNLKRGGKRVATGQVALCIFELAGLRGTGATP